MDKEQFVDIFMEHYFTGKASVLSDDLREMIFSAISREEELSSIRDEWGNWDFSYSHSFREGKLFRPWLDERLQQAFPSEGALPVWPNNKNFALCLTHDLDVASICWGDICLRSLRRTWIANPSLKAKLKQLLSFCWQIVRSAGRATQWVDYKPWLELERKFGFHSTFFVFPSFVRILDECDCIYKYTDRTFFSGEFLTVADMIRKIDQSGWEIGLHGSIQSARHPGMLTEQKRELEKVLGHSVSSVRQHYLAYDIRVTPRLQAEAGFLIDSTQGFNRSIGFRAGTAFPYPVWDSVGQKGLKIWEISQQVMDGALFANNSLEYDAEFAIQHCLELMERVVAVHGCLCLSWHPNTITNPVAMKVYSTLLSEAEKRNAWGCSTGELYRYWMTRGQV